MYLFQKRRFNHLVRFASHDFISYNLFAPFMKVHNNTKLN